MKKNWKDKSMAEIYEMTFEEACELVQGQIALGHKKGDYRPREHMTRALELVLAKATGTEPPKYHSQYKVTFRLMNPETKETYKMKAIIDIEESEAFSYGNHKCMGLDFSGSELKMESDGVDIRYDKRYTPYDEEAYIHRYISERWNGKNGAWKAAYVVIKLNFI